VLREIVTRPVEATFALIELPIALKRTLDETNELIATSRRKIEDMDRQTNDAILQAERMNELFARVVKLTEPLEMAQRGGDIISGALKRAIFGDEPYEPRVTREAAPGEPAIEAEAVPEADVVQREEHVAGDGVHSARAPEAETEPGPVTVPEPTPDPVPDPQPGPVRIPEPAPDPVPEPTPDPAPEPTPDPQPEPAPDQPVAAPESAPGDDWRPRGDLRAVPDPPPSTE
jgi:hypothetical protein